VGRTVKVVNRWFREMSTLPSLFDLRGGERAMPTRLRG
jgi:hypothetical protein